MHITIKINFDFYYRVVAQLDIYINKFEYISCSRINELVIGTKQNQEIDGKSQDTSSAIDLETQIYSEVEVQVQVGTGYSTLWIPH